MAMSFYTKSSNTIDVRTFYGFLNLSKEGRVPMYDHIAECQSGRFNSREQKKKIIRLAL